MPERAAFGRIEGYYSTLFHEFAHSTGHESRLNRPVGQHQFGTPEYGKEELVAEMAAAFLCGQAGIDGQLEVSAAYLDNWLGVLKNDRKLIVQAAAAAQKAADFVLGITPGTSTGEASDDAPRVHYERSHHAQGARRADRHPHRQRDRLHGRAGAHAQPLRGRA